MIKHYKDIRRVRVVCFRVSDKFYSALERESSKRNIRVSVFVRKALLPYLVEKK